MDTQQARQLLQKYHSGECTEAEKALLENSLLAYNEQEIDLSQERLEEIAGEVYSKLPIHRRNSIKLYAWASAAAAIVIAVLAIAHWRLEDNLRIFEQHTVVQDFTPGSNRATLTLANGRKIGLEGDKNGLQVGSERINYLDGSSVVADPIKSTTQTLTTPNAGQYHLILEDGTKVWLNAASSISYPSSFENVAAREVAITGEVYFEVAPNKSKRFLVKSKSQTVKVLGTHFNINDYGDGGKTVTTLVEGKVSVSAGAGLRHERLLAPGQQAASGVNGIAIGTADTELALAWKNGKLEFRDADIKDIMKQVARWYDLEVAYNGEMPHRVFSGSVSRSSNLSVLLKILAYSDIKFTLELNGNKRKLIVAP